MIEDKEGLSDQGFKTEMATQKKGRRSRSYLCPKCFQGKPDKAKCGRCGFDEQAQHDPHALPVRCRLAKRYIVGYPISSGQRSVIYLAFDTKKEVIVVVKEYFPRDLAKRELRHVRPYQGKEAEFQEGVADFLAEADILLRISHPNIVKCYGTLEENRTAYILMEYCEGESLFALLGNSYKVRKSPFDESHAIDVMVPILNALEYIHQENIIHCDISPKNIHVVRLDGPTISYRPILLDFGSAQRIGFGEQRRPITRTSGFSPLEQEERQSANLGCWTDVYACAATLYHVTTGKTPQSALTRRRRENLIPPQKLDAKISSHFSQALIDALALDYRRRTQTVKELRSSLLGPNYQGPSPIGPTSSVGATLDWMDGAANRMNTLFAPTLVLGAFLLCFSCVAWPVATDTSAPRATRDQYIVHPADFYILRDASSSPSSILYDALEESILERMRLSDPDSPDRSSYAIFSGGVYNGETTLQPATEGVDIVGQTKKLIVSRPLEASFRQTTRFDKLFNAIKNAIDNSDAGRKVFVTIITDGVPDVSGRETGCLEHSSISVPSPFHDLYDPLENLASNPRVELLLLLAGGRPECGQFVVKQWNGLRSNLPKDYRHRLHIISLAGFTDLSQIRDVKYRLEKYWESHRRVPCITLRPINLALTDEQRARFDAGEEFFVDFYVQSHLVRDDTGETELFVDQAEILDAKERRVGVADIFCRPRGLAGEAEDRVLLKPVSSQARNGENNVYPLFFQFRKEHRSEPSGKYFILPKVEGVQACRTGRESEVVNGFVAEPGHAARESQILGQRMTAVAIATSVFAVLFFLCAFWYRRNYEDRRKNPFLVQLLFERPFWYWIGFFVLTPFLLSVYFALEHPGVHQGFFLWGMGGITLLVCLGNCRVLMHRLFKSAELGPNEEIWFALQSFLLPLVSYLLVP